MKRLFAGLIGLLGLSRAVAAQPPQIITRNVPVPVLVSRNGFRIPARTNGASRRRKTNRLHLSTKTRNKHR